MIQVTDRKKLRREYLRKRAKAYVKGTVASILLIPAAVYFVLFVFAFLGSFAGPATNVIVVLSCVALTILMGNLTRWCWKARHAIKEARQLPYVPPVTASALPADEILVRGSEEPPVAQSDVLLRAAKGQKTAKEELLRVSQE